MALRVQDASGRRLREEDVVAVVFAVEVAVVAEVGAVDVEFERSAFVSTFPRRNLGGYFEELSHVGRQEAAGRRRGPFRHRYSTMEAKTTFHATGLNSLAHDRRSTTRSTY